MKCDAENFRKIEKAFLHFGMPLFDMNLKNFLNTKKFDVFRFGRKPVAIDIMTKVKGLIFDDAFVASTIITIDEIQVRLIQYDHLITAKKNAGRPKDLDDLDNL